MKKEARRKLVLIDGREFVMGNNCKDIISITEARYVVVVDDHTVIYVPSTSVLFERVGHGQIEVEDDNDEEFIGRTD